MKLKRMKLGEVYAVKRSLLPTAGPEPAIYVRLCSSWRRGKRPIVRFAEPGDVWGGAIAVTTKAVVSTWAEYEKVIPLY
jgi:hypothetical protein